MAVLRFKDQMNRVVLLPHMPERIVSLVPSQTELLFSLGLHDKIVGITKFCVHPKLACAVKTKVGGTKNLDLGKISALMPDLIIANKEENEAGQLYKLMQELPVWISDIQTLEDAYGMIESIGVLTMRQSEATQLTAEIKSRFEKLRPPQSKKKAVYLIWKKPFMAAANNTFINTMLEIAGFNNVLNDLARYPEITMNDLISRKPEYVLLSTEPFPFTEIHVRELQQEMPSAKVMLVDGQLFSWYGNRLLESAAYFQELRNQW